MANTVSQSIWRAKLVNRQMLHWLVFLLVLFAVIGAVSSAAAFLPPSAQVSVYAALALLAAYYFASNIHGSAEHGFVRSVDTVLNPIIRIYKRAVEKA